MKKYCIYKIEMTEKEMRDEIREELSDADIRVDRIPIKRLIALYAELNDYALGVGMDEGFDGRLDIIDEMIDEMKG